ncbi:HAD family hydrolase [Fusobacterium nucleatum]|uniref:HAD family hydrolase n=1 Tax=Fusobacterium nucleatum TaxID=851 RepID=UPI00235F3777|nr:HAD-IA family hydrolase [Fusobacterium nucleatum]WDA45687.1 HAD-IA family hydrolase [Fusobacterium nucleatum]
MNLKNKLAIFDLDGTLFDTKDVNYNAYQNAIKMTGIGIIIDYNDFCNLYNGKNYRDFLPKIIPNISEEQMKTIHNLKKDIYINYLDKAKKNNLLFAIIQEMKKSFFISIVTNASKKNVDDILEKFCVKDLFDLLITQEDIENPKPSAEGFLKVMDYFNISKENTIIFEDSEIGIQAAVKSGADYVKVYGYN